MGTWSQQHYGQELRRLQEMLEEDQRSCERMVKALRAMDPSQPPSTELVQCLSQQEWIVKTRRWMEQVLLQARHERLHGRQNFEGKKLHLLQVGLGTNTTVLQHLSGAEWKRSIENLVTLTGAAGNRFDIRYVGVEPVQSIVQEQCKLLQHFRHAALAQVALGEKEVDGMMVYMLKNYEEMLRQVTPSKKEDLIWYLSYLQNMSCVGGEHPDFDFWRKKINEEFRVQCEVQAQEVCVWNYGSLSKKLNFHGCEVLLLDTEGYDAQILKSVIDHCRWNPNAWPDVLQFETRGHCDKIDGAGTEKHIIQALEREGYMLLLSSRHDTIMMRKGAPEEADSDRGWYLKRYLEQCKCEICCRERSFPCYFMKSGQWACSWCMNASA